MSEHVDWVAQPDLSTPLVVVAFSGWGDAGDAATASVRWLVHQWQAEPLASINPNAFFDFTVARPTVRLEAGGQRAIGWPAIDVYHSWLPVLRRNVVLMLGREPHLRWPEFAKTVIDLLRRCGATEVATLGAFLGPVLHSAPVPLTGFAGGEELRLRLSMANVTPSSYQGQTGIVSVLHDAFHREGLPSLSLWAATPFYLGSVSPNPRVTHALVDGLNRLLSLQLDLGRLQRAAEYFDEQVAEQIGHNRELRELIARLGAGSEAAGGTPESASRDARGSGDLPSAEVLIQELEEFFRRGQSGGEGQTR